MDIHVRQPRLAQVSKFKGVGKFENLEGQSVNIGPNCIAARLILIPFSTVLLWTTDCCLVKKLSFVSYLTWNSTHWIILFWLHGQIYPLSQLLNPCMKFDFWGQKHSFESEKVQKGDYLKKLYTRIIFFVVLGCYESIEGLEC